jgi:hypothetical protein
MVFPIRYILPGAETLTGPSILMPDLTSESLAKMGLVMV